jgi:hypothetical protein
VSTPDTHAAAAALTAAVVILLAGCTSTVNGAAVLASQPAGGDGANVALMDTGRYPTRPSHPLGTAGSAAIGAVLEAQRMAEFVVGPWEINAKLRRLNILANGVTTDLQSIKDELPEPIPGVASAHGLITAFASSRKSSDNLSILAMTNLVMRFPDAGAATAAADEMAAKTGALPDPPRSPIVLQNNPDAHAWAHDYFEDSTRVESFTAHGPYVLYQGVQSQKSPSPDSASFAQQFAGFALDHQKQLIDRFTPTDPAKLAELPLDPTGMLLGRTLPTTELGTAALVGIWQPQGWLHFEVDPVASAARYAAAGVEVIAKGLTTVYRTNNRGGAARMVQRETTDPSLSVTQISGVPGLPNARCAKRQGLLGIGATLSEGLAHFRCVTAADTYAYIAYSDNEKDVKQQTAAQYRILAGE